MPMPNAYGERADIVKKRWSKIFFALVIGPSTDVWVVSLVAVYDPFPEEMLTFHELRSAAHSAR